MAGPGVGEARLIIECGSSRFVSVVRAQKGPVTAETFIDALPRLNKYMLELLERQKAKEVKQ